MKHWLTFFFIFLGIPCFAHTPGLDLSDSMGAGGIGGLLARTDANGSTYYHSDGAGNITALIDGQENIVARYMYGPFGKLLGQWGSMASANEMQFSSMPHDNLSGLSLYPFRAYEPNFQRWLNQDPIQELGGINLYRAMANNAWRYLDPLGLQEGEAEGEGAGPSQEQMAEENNGSLEEQAAQQAQLAASERAMREEGLDPNQVYIGPQNPPPEPPITPEQFAQNIQQMIDEEDKDRNPSDDESKAPSPAAKDPCPTGSSVPVSRWGRSGLQPGDWVMTGPKSPFNYLLSGKYQPASWPGANQPAPYSSGVTYNVPPSSLSWPAGYDAWKGVLGQRIYNP